MLLPVVHTFVAQRRFADIRDLSAKVPIYAHPHMSESQEFRCKNAWTNFNCYHMGSRHALSCNSHGRNIKNLYLYFFFVTL